jgi:hypothetical protein
MSIGLRHEGGGVFMGKEPRCQGGRRNRKMGADWCGSGVGGGNILPLIERLEAGEIGGWNWREKGWSPRCG